MSNLPQSRLLGLLREAILSISEQWRDGIPIKIVLVCYNEDKWKTLAKAKEVEGIVTVTGVPEMERALLEKNGLQIADDALYLEVDQDPEKTASFSFNMIFVGAGLVLLAVVLDRLRSAARRPKKMTRWDWKKGNRCFAQWPEDRYYYLGEVQEENGPEFRVLFDDGREACLSADQLAAPDIAPGTRVYVRWLGGSLYFPGLVKEREGAMLYILYDDGDVEWTTLSMIRVVF
jgi:hypothetical protein